MAGLLCEYKNILGEPKTGFHEARINIALPSKETKTQYSFARNDIIGTIIAAIIIAIVFDVSVFKAVFGLFAGGFFLHWLFCVDTESSRLIGDLLN